MAETHEQYAARVDGYQAILDTGWQRDMAVVARRGARLLTERLARLLAEHDEGGHYWLNFRAVLAGETRDDQGAYLDPNYTDDVVAHVWATHLYTRDGLAAAAATVDRYSGPTYLRSWHVTRDQALAMTTWPIVAAAYGMSERDRVALVTGPRGGIEQYQAEGR